MIGGVCGWVVGWLDCWMVGWLDGWIGSSMVERVVAGKGGGAVVLPDCWYF